MEKITETIWMLGGLFALLAGALSSDSLLVITGILAFIYAKLISINSLMTHKQPNKKVK